MRRHFIFSDITHSLISEAYEKSHTASQLLGDFDEAMRIRHVHALPSTSSLAARRHRNALLGVLVTSVALVCALLMVATGPRILDEITGGSGQLVGSAMSGETRAVLSPEHGHVGESLSVFDALSPAVTRLSPDLLKAVRRAATDASADGVKFAINSGWRSPEYQSLLWRSAVDEYGSEDEASRWVATARTSAHVSGEAVDIGPRGATDWLERHGAQYGLCQIYRNESWHYELRPEAVGRTCPVPFIDPTQDPRMHR